MPDHITMHPRANEEMASVILEITSTSTKLEPEQLLVAPQRILG